MSPDGDIFFTGIITGNGSGLSNVGVDTAVVFTDKLGLGDNERISLGIGSDLNLYHSGSNSFITNTTGFTSLKSENGILYLSGNSTHIRSGDDGETQAVFNDNGSCDLYYDNVKKFETASRRS